jgi:RND family efflux transporter MFP subunit
MNPNSQTIENGASLPDPGPAGPPSPPSVNPPGEPRTVETHECGKPRFGRLLIIVAILLAAGFAAGLLPRLRGRATTAAENRELAVPTVNVINPMPGKAAPPLTLSGELRPIAETAIYARASGYVRSWTADIGSRVEQGQLLAELDTPELNRELAQARAELTQADAARALAEVTSKRWKEMLATRAVSTQEADEKNADLDLKRATVEAARAKVERLADLLGFNQITAPFSGTITMRQLDVGQLVSEGASHELFRLTRTDKLRVFVRVPQSYARAVSVGQSAELMLPEIPGRKFLGKIVRTAGAMDASSRTLLTEIEVDNNQGELLAGSYSQVRLAEARPDAALTLPSNTLLFRPEGTQVAVVAENHVALRTVTLGRDFGAAVEILEGVTAGDPVIVNPADSIVSGLEVRIAAPKAVATR